jgi:hypothetical protein
MISQPIIICSFSSCCGLPCEHVLKITNELRHEMIHVQSWKINASYYNNDSTDLSLELKKMVSQFTKNRTCSSPAKNGEQMGVPVTDDIVCRAKRPSVDDNFPYLFDGTSMDDYNQAQFSERNSNCITIREWQEREGTL